MLTLASLPEATRQTGNLALRNVGPRTIRIDNRRLKPTPPDLLPAGRAQAVQGTFRYDPARQVAQGATAALRVWVLEKPDAWQAWAWNCHLQSWYQADGVIRHQATLDLQNAARQRLALTLPPGVARGDVRSVFIDGDPVAWQWMTTEGAGRLTVDLPAGQKSPRVVLEWMASGRPLGIAGSLAPPLLEPDVPTLARSWTAWLPPGYQSVDSPAQGPSPTGSGLSWSRRLFGPFGRDEGAKRFDPLSAHDWLMPLAWASAGSMPPSADPQGWTAWRTELNAAAPATLKFVHGDSMRLLGTIVFLLVAAAGCWKAAQRPALLVLVLGGFGAAALVAPVAYTPIASGGVLGALFCLAWRWMRTPRVPPAAETTMPKLRLPRRRLAARFPRPYKLGLLGLTVLPALLLGRVARGETPSAASRRRSGRPRRRCIAC